MKNLFVIFILNLLVVQINASDDIKINPNVDQSEFRANLAEGFLVIGNNNFLNFMMQEYAENLTCQEAAERVLKHEHHLSDRLPPLRRQDKIFIARALDKKDKKTRINDVEILARLLNYKKAIEDLEEHDR